MQPQAYGWPVAPAWGVGDVVSGTDPMDQPLTSSVTALGGTQKEVKLRFLAMRLYILGKCLTPAEQPAKTNSQLFCPIYFSGLY